MFKAEYIRDRINSGQYEYCSISSADGKHIIDCTQGPPGLLLASFDNFEANCIAGRYVITLYNENNTVKGRSSDFTAKKTMLFEKSAGASSQSGITQIDEISKLRDTLYEMRLKASIAEIEERQSNGVMHMLKDIFLLIQQSNRVPAYSPPPSLGNAQKINTEEVKRDDIAEPSPEMEQFAKKFERWQDLDPDLMRSIDGILAVAEKDPEKYAMFKGILLNSQNDEDNSKS